MPLVQTTSKSSLLPVSLAEAKAHLRIASDESDQEVLDALDAAVDYCERWAGVVLRTSHVREAAYETWPTSPIRFSVQPILSIGSVAYYDTSDSDQTVSSSDYRLVVSTNAGSILEFDSDYSKPSHSTRLDAVRITYTAGYSALTDVPRAGVAAIKLVLSSIWGDDDPKILELSKHRAHDLLRTVEWGSYR